MSIDSARTSGFAAAAGRRRRRAIGVAAGGALVAVFVVSGCSISPPSTPQPRTVSLADFVVEPPPEHAGSRAAEPASSPAMPAAAADASPDEAAAPGAGADTGSSTPPASDGSRALAAAADAATTAAAVAPGETVVVDAFVGEINGRPLFANEFFAPIHDHIIASRQNMPDDRQFAQWLHQLIQTELRRVIENELVLAEAEEALTPEEQQGLFHMLSQMRETIVAEQGGSRVEAERRLLQEQGLGVEELVHRQRQVLLVNRVIEDQIRSRVVVSWHDVQREYERRYDEFNPPPRLTVGRITLHTERDAAKIEQVKAALAGGDVFAAVAESVGQPDALNWQTFELGEDRLADVMPNEAIRTRILSLDEGETSEAFTVGDWTWWLHMTEWNQPPGQDLYDPQVQRQLTAQIAQRRMDEEKDRYITSLMEKGVYDDLTVMRDRLLDIAVQRYGRQ